LVGLVARQLLVGLVVAWLVARQLLVGLVAAALASRLSRQPLWQPLASRLSRTHSNSSL